ncbi:MAG: tRNA (adenosine(37)-N6)-dimethylallyltransferase MiaA [Coriobacteriia bacterium]|nr:tRNA (adenosine(37)-N6)-dimethylallyltransferase MiaA [Coriobacteriia bacterium]
MPHGNQVIAVVGATGTGKSALAEALAVKLGGEVVGADSMQVYKSMDIGTAKTPVAERRVPHHCVDLVEPGFPFTAALYQREARAAIERLLADGVVPVLCGGTGLYVRVALDDFHLDEGREEDGCDKGDGLDKGDGPFVTPVPFVKSVPFVTPKRLVPFVTPQTSREQLLARAEELGAEAFHAELALLDAESAALIHPHNVRRVIRAFELLEQGTSYAKQHEGFDRFEAVYPAQFVGITVEHEVLYEVIERRVDRMIAAGLLDEVRGLLEAGFADALTAQQAIGYKELVPVLAGERTLEDAVAEIKQSTRRYAKRQRTWFKRDERIAWIEATDLHRQALVGRLSGEEFAQALLAKTVDLLK